MIQDGDRLVVVVRNDLTDHDDTGGLMAAQALHAYREFIRLHPDVEKEWYEKSNHVVILAVQDNEKLEELLDRSVFEGAKVASFREPDLGNALTAIVLEPSEQTRKLVRRLPLLALAGR